MSDMDVREKRRKALTAIDDPIAQQRAAREVMRATGGPYAHLVGHDVLVMGVRNHYRGHLVGVDTSTPFLVRLLFHPLYDIDNVTKDSPEGETDFPSTPEQPAVLVETAIMAVSLQFPKWTKLTK